MCGRACLCIHLAHLHEWDFSIPPLPKKPSVTRLSFIPPREGQDAITCLQYNERVSFNRVFCTSAHIFPRLKQHAHFNPGSGGVLKFGFGRDVPLWNLKQTHTNTNFLEKVTHSYTNQTNFTPNFEQNQPFYPKFSEMLAQICENFEKSTHSYTKFCIL